MIKNIIQFNIWYWYQRYITCCLYWRINNNNKQLAFSIWSFKRLGKEYGYYEGEYATSWLKHFKIININNA
jgi:hypothetical protein